MAAAARGRDTGLLIGAPEPKKRKVTKKEYVPNIGTANYAILLTLLKASSHVFHAAARQSISLFLQLKPPHAPDFYAWRRPCAVLLVDKNQALQSRTGHSISGKLSFLTAGMLSARHELAG